MVTDIDINKLRNFKNYPFKLTLTENMKELIESIVINGIITPLIVNEAILVMIDCNSDFIEMEDVTPTVGQAIRMKKLELDGKLNEEIIEQIMLEEKPNQKEEFAMSYDENSSKLS